MNWRSSLLGAVIVMIAGAVVGVAIGGKTTTKTVAALEKTVTVTNTVTVTTGETTSPEETTSTGTSTPTTPPPGNKEKYLSDYLENQGGVETVNRNAASASMVSNPVQLELAGKTYQHAVAFQVDGQSSTLSSSVQLPTPGFTKLSTPAIGLETAANAKSTYHLTVYKNDDNSPNSVVLYQTTFHGPSTIRHMSFGLQGATDVLFVWTYKSGQPDYQDTFVLADPILTEP